MPLDTIQTYDIAGNLVAQEVIEDCYLTSANEIMEQIAFVEAPRVFPDFSFETHPVSMPPVKDSAMLGDSGYERNARDFYPTPANVTKALCQTLLAKQLLDPTAVIWEPACGDGQMVRVLQEHFDGVLASDICPLEGSGGFEANFLNSTPKAHFDAIITNPPFGEMIDKFMKRALIHLRDNRSKCKLVAFVARHELDCGVKRNKFFKDCPEYAAKITLTWRPRWIADSTGSPRHNYAIYVWVRKELNDPFGARLYYANNPDR